MRLKCNLPNLNRIHSSAIPMQVHIHLSYTTYHPVVMRWHQNREQYLPTTEDSKLRSYSTA